MTAGKGNTLRMLRGIGFGVLFATLLLSSVGVWLLSSDARREIDALAVANSDSTQWSLAQAEVELLTLKNALLEAVAAGDAADLDDVRQRFDVFFSRMTTISGAQVFASVREVDEVVAALETVDRFLQETAPLIDSRDDELRAALPDIAATAQEIRMELRAISLAGVQVFSSASETQRDRVANALFDLALLTLLLFVALLALVLALVFARIQSRRRTDEIRLTEDRLRAIVRTSLDGILVVGRDGRVLDFNGAAERIFGFTPEEAIGQPMAELIVPDHLREAHETGMARHIATGEKRVVDRGLVQLEAKHRSGRVFPVELSISTAESADGTIFVSFIRDISNRVEDQKELVDARDKALAGEKAKADLLAVMSHEMRTPLNGIIGSLQLLAETPLTNRQRKFVDAMGTSSDMLLRHVNTVLDISRIDAGHLEISKQVFDPVLLARDVVESLRVQAEVRGNTIACHRIGEAIGAVEGDPARLSQVLVNLLGNALKFTEHGNITLDLERHPDSDEVEFRVTDTGIGISEADQQRIFADFVTLDATYTREVEGTGLGLGIARRLVSVMGGEMGVESEPGEGSVFWLRVPLPPADTAALALERAALAEPQAVPAADDVSVLLVEDNEINRLVAREMLGGMGCAITEAMDGTDGIAKASVGRYDLILMDISMPNLDGIEATRAIRARGPNAETPIVALTAHALPDDIKRFHEAGMNDVIVKPLERSRLAEILKKLRNPMAASKAGAAASPTDARHDLVATLGSERAMRVIGEVRAEIRAGLGKMERMIREQQAPSDIGDLAHKLAGIAALIGFAETRKCLIEIEAGARRGKADRLASQRAAACAAFERER